RKCWKRGAEIASSRRFRSLALEYMRTTRAGSLNGKARRKRSLIKLKIAVFSPMPRASVAIAMKLKLGDFSSRRRAYRRSFITQCHHRIDVHDATRWQIARKQCRSAENNLGVKARPRSSGTPRTRKISEVTATPNNWCASLPLRRTVAARGYDTNLSLVCDCALFKDISAL